MDRGAAHAAIVLILTHTGAIPQYPLRSGDVANDILNAIWPDLASIWEEGHDAGWENRGLVQTGQLIKVDVTNPYAAQPP